MDSVICSVLAFSVLYGGGGYKKCVTILADIAFPTEGVTLNCAI